MAISTACATGLYCYSSIDLEAISVGTVDHTIAEADVKIEFTATAANEQFFVGSNINNLTFGPQANSQGTDMITSVGKVDLYHTDSNSQGYGTFIIFTATGSLLANTTFDWWDVYGGIGNSLN